MTPLYVFVGGGVGSVLRWAIAQWQPAPWGTLLVNVVGSALLAFLAHPSTGLSAPWKSALCVGAMGGFTTYSTFNLELLAALSEGRPRDAAFIAFTTLLTALVAGFAGWTLAGWVGR